MLEKYRSNFGALAPEQVHRVAEAVTARHGLMEVPDAPSGVVLWRFCEEAHLDHAAVVLSLARDSSPVGVAAIETLVGRPITRVVAPPPKKSRVRGAAKRRSDTRTVAWVADNPKKPGSAAHARFALYAVGSTVDEALAAGVRAEDVRYDLAHGYIRVE